MLLLFLSLAAASVDTSSIEHLRPAQPVIPARTFQLTEFGAVGDGDHLNTGSFQRAISAVEAAGGGTLVVPRGVFRTLPFKLCSNLNLHLEDGAVIEGPASLSEYGYPDAKSFHSQKEASAMHTPAPLISGDDLHDLAITGNGTVDGNGSIWWPYSERSVHAHPDRYVLVRPFLCVINHCSRLLISDVTFQNSPKFHLVPRNITDLTIARVKIRAPENAQNTDGIDPGPVTNAWITGCDTDTGDDDICIKSGGHNVLIEDCTIHHGHGISIGSETTVGISNMLVRNCTMDGTDNGIRIKSMRGAGGPVRNVHYDNITMHDVANAILLDLHYVDNNRPNFRGDPSKLPSIEGILIENVHATGAKNAGRIVGLEDSPIRGIVLRNVSIQASKPMVIREAESPVLENCQIPLAAAKPAP